MIAVRHLAVLLGAGSLAFPALAAPPPAGAPVALHIDAIGTAAPDYAVAAVTLNGTGSTREAAEKVLAERRETLLKTLSGMGIAADKVKLGGVTAAEQDLVCFDSSMCSNDSGAMVPTSDIPAEAYLPGEASEVGTPAWAGDTASVAREIPVRIVATAGDAAADASSYGMRRAHLWIAVSEGTVQVNDLAKLADVGTAISATGKWNSTATRYEFINRPKSHKAALADGLARARAEADTYAASIGYRVVRIKAMSNTGAPFAVTDIFTMLSRTEGPGKDMKFMQSDFAPVGVDFVLGPK